MKQYIVKKILNMDTQKILNKAIRYFISACGITLLLCFFYGTTEKYTKEDILQMVSSVFFWECLFSCIISMIQSIIKYPHQGYYTEIHIGQKAIQTDVFKEKEAPEVDKNREISAVHEAGHAVMAYLKGAEKIDINMNRSCVVTEYALADRDDLKNYIQIAYAGAAAEEIIFGHFYSGCFGKEEADFESATKLIKGYIVMSDGTVSKTMLEEELGPKAIELSKSLYSDTIETLVPYKDMVAHLAELLKTRNSLKTEEVKEILGEFTVKKNSKGFGNG